VIPEAQRLGSHGESLSHGGEGIANDMMSGFMSFVALARLQCWIKFSSKLKTSKVEWVPMGATVTFP
jgi:hypothetical protein